MELHELEQQFNKVWGRANPEQREELLDKMNRLIVKKEAEKRHYEAFFNAVQSDSLTAVRKILHQDIDVNQKNNELGNTALTLAVINGNIEIIQLLLDYNAEPQIENEKGYNSIDAAKLIGNEEITKLITKC